MLIFLKFIIASEWKNFLLFYIPAVLPGILPDKFLAHVFLLIKSIRIMLSSEIIEEDVIHFWRNLISYLKIIMVHSLHSCWCVSCILYFLYCIKS